jgi:hypothetical protein
MCRSIKPLRSIEGLATEDEVREAALQFVRKVSGIRKPTARNADAFDDAVASVAAITSKLLAELPESRSQPPKPSNRRRFAEPVSTEPA